MADTTSFSSLAPSVLEVALGLHAQGMSVVPIGEGKRPPFPWKHLQAHRPTADEVQAWFTRNPQWGLGVLTGKASGNLLMVEIEGRAAHYEEALRSYAHDHGHADLWERLANGWVERTPSGGTHYYMRCTEPIEGNKKLARRPTTEAEQVDHPGQKVTVLAETRGEGGLSIIAPTPGFLHPTGKPWEALRGSGKSCPTFTPEEIAVVYEIFSSIDHTPTPTPAPAPPRKERVRAAGERLTTFEDYDQRSSWEDILLPEGWTIHHADSAGTVFWTRPGKNPVEGISATTGYGSGQDRLYVFSTSTEFDSERPYSKSQAYAHLHYAGDLSAAAKDLYRQGYGDRFPSKPTPRYRRGTNPPQRAARIEQVGTTRVQNVETATTPRLQPTDTPHSPTARASRVPDFEPTHQERTDVALNTLKRISASLTRPKPMRIATAARNTHGHEESASSPSHAAHYQAAQGLARTR